MSDLHMWLCSVLPLPLHLLPIVETHDIKLLLNSALNIPPSLEGD